MVVGWGVEPRGREPRCDGCAVWVWAWGLVGKRVWWMRVVSGLAWVVGIFTWCMVGGLCASGCGCVAVIGMCCGCGGGGSGVYKSMLV